MANFLKAVELVLRREGGLDWNPHDAGGITNWGITIPVLRELGELGDTDHNGVIDPDDIRSLSREGAIQIYRIHWWDAFGYGEIPDQEVARKTFDLAVNTGPTQGHKIVQRALRAVSRPVLDDGCLGPKTMAQLKALSGGEAFAWLVAARSEAAGIYRQIIAKRPDQAEFAAGWFARAYDEWN